MLKLLAFKCVCICNPILVGLTCILAPLGRLFERSSAIVGNRLNVDILVMLLEKGINRLSATQFVLSNTSSMSWLEKPACMTSIAKRFRE